MTKLRIAVQTRCFAQPFRKALHTAASIQCDGVQFDARNEVRPAELSDTGLRQLRKMLDDLNLRVGSMYFPTRRGYSEPSDLDRRDDATVAAIKVASQLQSKVLVCDLGRIPESATDPAMDVLTEVFTALGSQGIRYGVQLAAQARYDTLDLLKSFLAALPEGSLYLDLHPGRLLADGHSPEKFVSALGQYIAHVHAVDGVRDFATGRNVEVVLGRGSADFPGLLGHLEEFDYRGWLTIERRDSDAAVEEMANAVKFLRAI